MASFETGQRVAERFVIEGKLASGGMAQVYVAQMELARGVRRPVVIKRVHPHLAEDASFVEMFVEEARLASQLNHPGLVAVLDALESRGELMLVLDHIPGWDLAAVVDRSQRPLPDAAIRYVLSSVLQTLAYVHAATDSDGNALRVVHRDVTPSNLLAGADGTVRLLDFGVAKAARRRALTAVGSIKGKLEYMAPEQAAGKAVDARTDLYCVGLVAYELMTGERAIRGDDEATLLATARAPDIRIPPGAPADLRALAEALLRPSPEDRPADAAEAQTLLLGLGEREALQQHVNTVMGSSARVPKRGRSAVDAALLSLLDDQGPSTNAGPRSLLHAGDATLPTTGAAPISAVTTEPSPTLREPNRYPRVALAVAALGLLGAAGFAVLNDEQPPAAVPAPVDIPAVIPGFLRLSTDPPGAEVTVDGSRHTERTPTLIEHPPGTAHVELLLDDYQSLAFDVDLESGATAAETRTLIPRPGELSIRTDPEGAIAELNGEALGTTPVERADLPREVHQLVLRKDGFRTITREIDLASTSRASVHEVLSLDVRRGEVWVNADVQRATLEIDGRRVSTNLPWRGRVTAGNHRIRVIPARGGRPATKRVVVRPGQTTRVGLRTR